MALAIFDLDQTILEGDCDQLWGDFLAQHGLVDRHVYQRRKNAFYQDYLDGTLDIHAFMRFALGALKALPMTQLLKLRHLFAEQHLRPLLRPKALQRILWHRQRDDRVLIITATNIFLAGAAAEMLGVTDVIASDPEIINGEFTGEVKGVPAFGEGKVLRLYDWLTEQEETLTDSCFYSDSHNDLPLLTLVSQAYAVTPDPFLHRAATRNGWPILDFSLETALA